jgi:glycyl-tRNA synthetase beta chain
MRSRRKRLTRVTEGKGEFLFFAGSSPVLRRRPAAGHRAALTQNSCRSRKRMRWGASAAEFVRPVHWLTLLFGVDVTCPRASWTQMPGRTTRGHRFMAPQEFALARPGDYETVLREQGKVIPDFGERRARIGAQVLAAAESLSGEALLSDSLLDEVTALVEWPSAIAGSFEPRFLELPREVLI